MRNWAQWRARKAARSERARAAAEARWSAVRAARADEPVREGRVVEITIRDTRQPMRVLRLQAEPRELGWSRWAVSENGVRVGRRRFGRSAISDLIARSLS